MEDNLIQEHTTGQNSTQSTQSLKQSTFAGLINKVGSFGIYQKLTLFLLFIAACVCGQYTTITPFLFYQEEYQCTVIAAGFSSCLDYVCSLPPQQRLSFIPAERMVTLATKFGDFRCSDESLTINLMILIMYVGIIVSYLVMSLWGDYFGRKPFVIVGAATAVLGTLLAVVAQDLYLAAVGLLFGAFGVQIIFGISFSIVSQIVAAQYKDYALVMLQVFYSIGHLTDTGFYFWLQDWQKIFVYFFIIPMALFLLFYLIIAVDTPIVLVTTLTPQDAYTEFLWISKVNGLDQPLLTVQEIAQLKAYQRMRESEESKVSKFSILDIFKYPSLRWMTVVLILVQISISFLYFAPNLMLDEFQMSIFIYGAVYGLATVISTALMYFVINRFPRRAVAIWTFSITFVCSFVLIFVYRPKVEGEVLAFSSNIGILLAIFIITFCITAEWTFFFVYITQLYPTQVRVIGTSLVSLSSAITLSVASFIINGAINSGFSVMLVFTIFAASSLIFSFCLPETLAKKQSDFIQQLQVKMIRRQSLRSNMALMNHGGSEKRLKKWVSQETEC